MLAKKAQADLLLLIVSLIWGFAFVAQRVGMETLGPFGFNGLRFLLGACSLLPLLLFFKSTTHLWDKELLKGSCLAGLILFAGASLQQAGLVYTTAGNGGFITGLYIILVPVLGLFLGQVTQLNTWLGGGFAVIGLYLLSFSDLNSINLGDVLTLLGAVCWALHVLIIAKLAPKVDNLRLAIIQFLVCAFCSLGVAMMFEQESFSIENAQAAWVPIAYAGLISVGIAYTLQIIAQRHAPPSHAAIIMSLEVVAAAFGGWLILDERFSSLEVLGCTLMLIGMLVSQLPALKRTKARCQS